MTAGALAALFLGLALGLVAGLAVGLARRGRDAERARAEHSQEMAAAMAAAQSARAQEMAAAQLHHSQEMAAAQLHHSQEMAAAQSAHAQEILEKSNLVTTLRAELEHQKSLADQREAAWEEARRNLVGEFATLSKRALSESNETFLQLAHTSFKEAQQASVGDLEKRQQAIGELVAPLREQLDKYAASLREMENERTKAYTALTEQVGQLAGSQEQLQSETRKLVTALRAPATRGRWGEQQLRRVVEMAGMIEHCDFDEQVSTRGEDGLLRPDMIVHLPGAKQVVVDAKVPMEAFIDATESTDEAERKERMAAHARQLRSHVDSLAKKAYWQQFEDSPDFVVAFIPGDPLLAAAFEEDPNIFEHAVSNHVLLATPTTLIAVLRAVAYGWQQEALAEHAREVQSHAQELYRRLSTFADHMARTGKSLGQAVTHYNQAVGSLERSVLPEARRFGELGVVTTADKPLPELDELDATARILQAPELTAPSVEAQPDGSGDPDG